MIRYSVFVVDDDPSILEGMKLVLGKEFDVQTHTLAESALEAMENSPPDLVLLDIGLPGMSGIDALGKIKEGYPEVLVVMITAYEEISMVISAMKLGAYDYVVKPLNMEGLRKTILNALSTIRLRKEVQVLQERYLRECIPCFIGESDAIQNVMEFIETVAKSPDTPVLLLGGTGTGKELLAGSIHYRSPKFKGPLITVNCAAIPKELIESELFGYEKGAFTGARGSGKSGLIEEAREGTLFLDEVGDLSLAAQAKLLRFLDDGEFYRVGGTKKLRVVTRLVSATNKDIDGMVASGAFREDLYYRIGVIKVLVPSLNERRGDIIPLAKHFLTEYSRKFGKKFTKISRDAENALMEHTWSGNVRELRNIVERAALMGKGPELTAGDLGLADAKSADVVSWGKDEVKFPPIPREGIDAPSILTVLEKHFMREALRETGGNERGAARLLNVNYHTFRYRMKKLKIG